MNDIRPTMTSQSDVKVLICYIFDRFDRPITAEQLSMICESVGVDWFLMTGALDDLVATGALTPSDKGYVPSDKVHISAEEFAKYLPLVFRRQVLRSAADYFRSAAAMPGCVCETLEREDGAYVRFSLDGGASAIDLTVFAGSIEQAETVRDNIARDPIAYYGRITAALLEDPPDTDVEDML